MRWSVQYPAKVFVCHLDTSSICFLRKITFTPIKNSDSSLVYLLNIIVDLLSTFSITTSPSTSLLIDLVVVKIIVFTTKIHVRFRDQDSLSKSASFQKSNSCEFIRFDQTNEEEFNSNWCFDCKYKKGKISLFLIFSL